MRVRRAVGIHAKRRGRRQRRMQSLQKHSSSLYRADYRLLKELTAAKSLSVGSPTEQETATHNSMSVVGVIILFGAA